MINVDTASFIPFYEQIKQQIKRQIVQGRLQAHAPLPSIRDLATRLIINPNTVARAYRELEKEGFIYAKKGKGCYISDESAEVIDTQRQDILNRIFDEAIREALKYDLDYEAIREQFVSRIQSAAKDRREGV
jgi:GntR family transcriptional regulator